MCLETGFFQPRLWRMQIFPTWNKLVRGVFCKRGVVSVDHLLKELFACPPKPRKFFLLSEPVFCEGRDFISTLGAKNCIWQVTSYR